MLVIGFTLLRPLTRVETNYTPVSYRRDIEYLPPVPGVTTMVTGMAGYYCQQI